MWDNYKLNTKNHDKVKFTTGVPNKPDLWRNHHIIFLHSACITFIYVYAHAGLNLHFNIRFQAFPDSIG